MGWEFSGCHLNFLLTHGQSMDEMETVRRRSYLVVVEVLALSFISTNHHLFYLDSPRKGPGRKEEGTQSVFESRPETYGKRTPMTTGHDSRLRLRPRITTVFEGPSKRR